MAHAALADPLRRGRVRRRAEAAAHFFGTPNYIIGQTLVVIAWIVRPH